MKAYLVGRMELKGGDAEELIRLVEDMRRQYPDIKLSVVVYTEEEDAVGRLIDSVIDVIDDITGLEEELGISHIETVFDETKGGE